MNQTSDVQTQLLLQRQHEQQRQQNQPSPESQLTPSLLRFMAIACGLTVANIYFNQPLLTQLQQEFNVSVSVVGQIPTATQLGYAFGMLLLTPLGDKFDRKRLIVAFTFAVTCALVLTALAPTFLVLEIASFLIGLTAVGAQIIMPHVADLAPEKSRGEAVGRVMTGLLLGILLARTASGFLGSYFGWRAVFLISALTMALSGLVMMQVLPSSAPRFRGTYRELLFSVFQLLGAERVLRQSTLIGACLFAAFSSIWATLIFLLSSTPFHLGPKSVGLFGLLGAAGAVTASFVGKVADRKSPLWTLTVALLATFISFVGLSLSCASLWGLIVWIFLMDAGVQAAHVSNQARFFKIRPDARSRMNTVYMFFYFVGGATGSMLGAWAWGRLAWYGVCGVSLFFTLCALLTLIFMNRSLPTRESMSTAAP